MFMMIIMKLKDVGYENFYNNEKFQGDGLIKSAPGFSGLLGQVKTSGGRLLWF